MRAVAVLLSLAACGDEASEPRDFRRREPPRVTASEYCQPVAAWDAGWAVSEAAVLDFVNAERATGGSCNGVALPPVAALGLDDRLTCAARVHAADMAARGYFDHINPEGELPHDRMELAGYSWQSSAENIARGYTTPRRAVDGWLGSTTGHCEALMSSRYVDTGVGYTPDGQHWVQLFGHP